QACVLAGASAVPARKPERGMRVLGTALSDGDRMDAGLDLPAWLREVEQHFGGLYKTRRGKVSPHDPRGQSVAHRGTMRGGDRMGHHGYAEAYAGVLSGLLGRNDPTIVEL